MTSQALGAPQYGFPKVGYASFWLVGHDANSTVTIFIVCYYSMLPKI